MIPRAHIVAWRKIAPWQSNEQVEQDLVISRALVEIYSDDLLRSALAFRGATVLHKLYLQPAIRYSEDIDLVQTKAEPIGEILDRLRERLVFLGSPKVRQKERSNTMIFSFDSEIAPSIPMKLKLEVNCREHFAVFGWKLMPYAIESRWFTGQCELTTFELEELLGSKLRALYQRKKGRDIFDLWYALKNASVDSAKVIEAFYTYMQAVDCKVTRRQFQENVSNKLTDRDFGGDVTGLLRAGIQFNKEEAFELVNANLVDKMV
ncbi:MAG: nucleotidyl transferase AbiEii/AbiGii toxin family protein [bacterium]